MDLSAIQQLAATEMAGKASHPFKETGNKYTHGQRVAKIIAQLAPQVGYTKPLDLLTVVAWFHDICNGTDNHAVQGADKTRELLKPYCTAAQLALIHELIAIHDCRSLDGLSLEAQLQQDADHLDHFGTFEIWAAFQYATKEDRSFAQAATLLQAHFEENFQVYKDGLHFAVSKDIYDEKQVFTRAFLQRMQRESVGKIVDFDRILLGTDGL